MINQYTKYKLESIVLYFLLLYSISTLTQIRVGVASALFFWAIGDIYKRNLFRYFFKISLAITFHSMAVVFIVFYFLSLRRINKKIYFLVLPVGILIWQFVAVFKEFVKNNIVDFLPGFVGAKVYSYLSIEEQAISTFNLWFIFVVFVYYLVLFKLEKFQDQFNLYVRVIALGILMYFSFNFISILSIRIMNSVGLLVLILIPSLVRVYKPSPLFWSVFFIMAFLLFLNWNVRNQLLRFDVLF